ncbi:sodium:proton antiporter [Virgibacillus sp. NKC19-16]|uniref:cation:proton antiporter n=1 Tax=Virgibacillus salidurans TaxID=2831673 RepID=UPI001F165CDB|nr:sodium:proton antiporter [Virgibacillus sp. NKC19-16]UJL47734.1 sodium:proton antiporter [Virgibacillus sp. NKC19-16]
MSSHQVLLLLLVGYIVFSIDKKQTYFPVPVILVLLGLSLAFVPYFDDITISKELIFNVFLPALLFTSAYNFPLNYLRKNKWIITCLGTVGVLLTVILLGSTIYFVSNIFIQMSFVGALLIASILTPTDPVSVVSILKKSLSDEKIADIVEGESLLNDGTSIVLFSIFLGMFVNETSFSLGMFLGEFLFVSIGGIVLGVAFGWLMSKAVHYSKHRTYQVMLSVIVAYGSFYLGELIGVSGVLSTVTAGMMLSFEFGKNIKEDHFRDSLDGFWNIVEPSVLALLFLLIGIQAAEYLIFSEWTLAIIIFILSLAVRWLVLTGLTQAIPTWKSEFALKDSSLITWSGIKGSMSVALLMGFEAAASNDDILISLTFAAVLLSLVIQSVGVYPLTKRLKG